MYMLHPNGIQFGVIRVADNVWIPNSTSNRDWQEYLVWAAKGNSPLPFGAH
jgi:hypothetical protein